jgi:hypothetical protein
VEGKRILIYVEFVQVGNNPNGGEPGGGSLKTQLTLNRQGTDMILSSGDALVTSAGYNRFAELISHSGVWYTGASY